MGLYIPPENKRRDEINIKKSTIRLFKEVLDRIQEDHDNPNLLIFSDLNTNIKRNDKYWK